ncbi:RING-H2 finger protein ATL48-like [Cucurbita moschata]|uniref:RING-H2 finger protein ATL48-like n=2 Tax=Cucurbita TaxID=3660 RepID=A0A6J1GSJ9_CUCMO|nr:RING-H2 finger protein ATL48-like [Cucurbita moschata]
MGEEDKGHGVYLFLSKPILPESVAFNPLRLLFLIQILLPSRVVLLETASRFTGMSSGEPNLDEFFVEKKRARNPLVPVGAFVTAGVLTAGLISFRQGNSQLGQMLMRARVVVQGATVALMVGTAFYYGENPWRPS